MKPPEELYEVIKIILIEWFLQWIHESLVYLEELQHPFCVGAHFLVLHNTADLKPSPLT